MAAKEEGLEDMNKYSTRQIRTGLHERPHPLHGAPKLRLVGQYFFHMSVEVVFVNTRSPLLIRNNGHSGKNHNGLPGVNSNWRSVSYLSQHNLRYTKARTYMRIELAAFARFEMVAICGSTEWSELNQFYEQGTHL